MASQQNSSRTSESNDLSQFKSPLRMLVRCFKRGRDNWKRKYMDRQADAKRDKNRAADACRSRDKWKSQAKSLKRENRRLERELAQARPGAADAKKKRRR